MYKTLGKIELENAELMAGSPPKFSSDRKREFYERARKEKEKSLNGSITVSRVTPDTPELESCIFKKGKTKFKDEAGYFDYAADKNTEDRYVWWMNFADPKLFGYYGGSMFAQDEIQVFEHPILGSLREYLLDGTEEGMKPWALTLRNGQPYKPTPYLIEQAPQWQKVDTTPRLPLGGIGMIYGHNFSTAPDEELEAGIKIVDDDIRNNIMACSAIVGSGQYSYEDIELQFKTLLCAYKAAKDFSSEKGKRCIVHGGMWGCGAFGGNPELMLFLQICAAGLCGVDELILHAVDDDAFEDALDMYLDMEDEMSLDGIIMMLYDKEYYWGLSDGN